MEDWLANAYEGMSRRQFLARMSAAGFGLAGFAAAADAVEGEVITTPALGLVEGEGKISRGDFQIPIYEAHPAASGKFPVVLVLPEIFGMHAHIQDVTRRFAREGFLSITFEPYARDGGVLHLPDIASVRKVADQVPDERVLEDLDALVAYARRHPAGQGDRIGVTGFCRGGMYTLLFAAHSRELRAAVAWYGQIRPAQNPGRPFGRSPRSGRANQDTRPRPFWRGGPRGYPRPMSRSWRRPSRLPAKRRSLCFIPGRRTPFLRITAPATGRRRPQTPGAAAWPGLGDTWSGRAEP